MNMGMVVLWAATSKVATNVHGSSFAQRHVHIVTVKSAMAH